MPGVRYSTERIISALKRTNGLVSLAAREIGCTPQVIYRRAQKIKAVQETIDEARDSLIDSAELALRSAVLDKEPWAVALTLKTLGRHRGYVERGEITGAEGQSIVVRFVQDD